MRFIWKSSYRFQVSPPLSQIYSIPATDLAAGSGQPGNMAGHTSEGFKNFVDKCGIIYNPEDKNLTLSTEIKEKMNQDQKTDLFRTRETDAVHGLWQTCVDQLAQELPEQQFNTWIKPLSAEISPDHSKMTIQVANRFKLDWIRAQYSGRIAFLLEKINGQPILVELALAPRESPAKILSLIHI